MKSGLAESERVSEAKKSEDPTEAVPHNKIETVSKWGIYLMDTRDLLDLVMHTEQKFVD